MSLVPLRTLRDVFTGGKGPESIALQIVKNGDVEISVGRHELVNAIERVSWQLKEAGVVAGSTVSIAMPNSLEYVIAFLAVTWIRAVAAPLNPRYKENEFAFYIQDVDSRIVIVGAGGNSEAERAAQSLKRPCYFVSEYTASCRFCDLIPHCKDTVRDRSSLRSSVWTLDAPLPTDVALYLHTSGTTGKPKLVPLSHHNLCTSMGNIRNTYELDSDDICYLVMPLFHVHGLIGGMLSTFCSGGVVALPSAGRFSASVFWRDIVACRATWYTAVPTIHQVLLKHAMEDSRLICKARLRFIRSCSSALAPAVLDSMEKSFGAPVVEAYAMTESAHQISSNPLPKNGQRIRGSVGKGMNVQISIMDNGGARVGPGVVGNVYIRGENVTVGYCNNADANNSVFRNGWFDTGDQGFLDSNGYLTLTGRVKELINRSGEKISPGEIDQVCLSHPDVLEAVAFGSPHELYGEQVSVAIVLKKGRPLSAEQIIEFCAKRLSKEKVPGSVFIADSIPKTATGKIQRRAVAAKFNRQSKL